MKKITQWVKQDLNKFVCNFKIYPITYTIFLLQIWFLALSFHYLYILSNLIIFITTVLLHILWWYLIYPNILLLIPKFLRIKIWNIIFHTNNLLYLIIIIFYFYIWFHFQKYASSAFEFMSFIMDRYYFDPVTFSFQEYADKKNDLGKYLSQLLFHNHMYNIIPVYIYWHLISYYIMILNLYYYIYYYLFIYIYIFNYYYFFSIYPLYFILNLFLFAILYLFLICNKINLNNIRVFSTVFFNIIFLLFFVIFIYASYNLNFNYFLFANFYYLNLFNINFIFGLDNLSLLLILLTSFLFCIVNLVSLYNIKYNYHLFCLNLIILELFIILTFLSINLLVFYIFFELSLLPMFLMIGVWGSRQRKLYAVYQFFFYTLLGSVFLLSGIFILYSTFNTLDIRILSNFYLPYDRQLLIWLLLFLGFSTKIPLVPFHVWLPEAHVEAPTAGSIILAGILLKIGTYGILRFILPIFFFANHFYSLYVYTLCVISIVYISLIIITQIDFKKIIAYSSILHMNFIVLGLFSYSLLGVTGAILLMISHGLISSGLFICAGILYDRYKTRNIIYYGGLANFMPIFSTCFFLLILSNISFPLTSNFIGECLVGFSIIENNFFLLLIMIFSTFFATIYSIWLFNRIIFGNNLYLFETSDLTEREFISLILIILPIFILGCKPQFLINLIEFQSLLTLEFTNF